MVVELIEEPFGFVLGSAIDDDQMRALHPAQVIDQSRGFAPGSITQRRFMQRRDGCAEFVLLVHVERLDRASEALSDTCDECGL